MNLQALLQSVADPLRLRILSLLTVSPLCVQHLQTALNRDQVTVSKQLLILKGQGLVISQKIRTWRLYRLPPNPSRTTDRLLACLQALITEEGLYEEDRTRLAPLLSQVRPFLHSKKERQRPIINREPLRPTIEAVPEEPSAMEDYLL